MATKKTNKKAAVNAPSAKTIDKHVAIMEKLVTRGKGKLPTYTWLNDNGYFRSYEVMRQYPAKFKHIIKNRAVAR